MGGVYKTTFSTETEKNEVSERFRHGFRNHLGQFCGPLGHLCAPRPLFFPFFFPIDFPIDFSTDFGAQRGPPERTLLQRGLDSGAVVKRTIPRKA